MIRILIGVLTYSLIFCGYVFRGHANQNKIDHPGSDVTPLQAWDMVQKDQEHTFLVDVRSKPEYMFSGHPLNAHNVPSKFWTGRLNGDKYVMQDNLNFEKDLLARFNPETDCLIILCSSGHRSARIMESVIYAGGDAETISNVRGGFEGEWIKTEDRICKGRCRQGG